MQTKAGRLAYISKDYESIREELLSRIPLLTDRWTDFNASDLGIVLLELFSGIADMLAYYIDAQAGECYLPTARQRQNIINLCSLIGYRLQGPVSAGTRLTFTLTAPFSEDLTIPAGTTVRAPDTKLPVPFVTTKDFTIAAGSISGEVDAVQGEMATETFTATGQPSAVFMLAKTDIAHGTVKVTAAGVDWTCVDHFAESASLDAHFRVETDGLDRVTVAFGDGRFGAIPREGVDVTVSYLVTLGPNGNLAPHRVTELVSPVYTSDGIPVVLTVDNPIPATGGCEKETSDHARSIAPAVLRSTWKAVTREDYRSLCLAFPGIAKARVMDINDDPSLRIYTVRICVAPEGGGVPSPALKYELTEYLEARRLLTIDVGIVDPVYVPVDVSAKLYIYPNEDVETVRKRAIETLGKRFLFANQDFASAVYPSDLVALLDGVEGVSHVVLGAPVGDILPGFREIPMLGDVTFDIEVVR